MTGRAVLDGLASSSMNEVEVALRFLTQHYSRTPTEVAKDFNSAAVLRSLTPLIQYHEDGSLTDIQKVIFEALLATAATEHRLKSQRAVTTASDADLPAVIDVISNIPFRESPGYVTGLGRKNSTYLLDMASAGEGDPDLSWYLLAGGHAAVMSAAILRACAASMPSTTEERPRKRRKAKRRPRKAS